MHRLKSIRLNDMSFRKCLKNSLWYTLVFTDRNSKKLVNNDKNYKNKYKVQ